MRLEIILGSTSDKDKVLPGIQKFAEHHDVDVAVHFASADNTPDKVRSVLESIKGNHIAYISGAGMSNVLTGVVKGYASSNDIVIGLPISDNSTGGVSSLLSTSERPPLNPVLTAGIDNSYAAMNLGYRFIQQFAHDGIRYNKVIITSVEPLAGEDTEAISKIQKNLDELNIPYGLLTPSQIGEDDLVITPHKGNTERVYEVDKRLREGLGVQIAVCDVSVSAFLPMYSRLLEKTEATGLVGVERFENAVYAAAYFMQNSEALNILYNKKSKKTQGLESETGLLIKKGEIRKL
jgi:phosphoribosylcarboxyaminoimidazole (NCAIR) mutase